MSFDLAAALEPHLGFRPTTQGLSNAPFLGRVYVRASPSGDQVDVSFLAIDSWPAKVFWPEDGSRGSLRRFRSASARDRHLARLSAEDMVAFDVARAARGEFEAAPVGSVVNPVGVYCAPADSARQIKDGEATIGQVLVDASATLKAFSAWSRGEVFGVVRDRFVIDRERLSASIVDTEKVWGFCGAAEAEQAIPSGAVEQYPVPTP